MNSQTHGQKRAQRFGVVIPIRYRSADSAKWHSGKAENISCSGVLLRGRDSLKPATRVELSFAVPPQLSGDAELNLLCSGSVVRTVQSRVPFGRSAMGVMFESCRLARKEEDKVMAVAQSTPPFPMLSASDTRHKLNNLMMIVLGTCEVLLLNPELDPETRDSLMRIRDAAESAGKLTKQIR